MFAVDPGEQQVITRVLSASPLYKRDVPLFGCSACGPAAVGATRPGDRAKAVRGPAGGAAGGCWSARGGDALYRDPAPGVRRAAAGEAVLCQHTANTDVERLCSSSGLKASACCEGHLAGVCIACTLHVVCHWAGNCSTCTLLPLGLTNPALIH